MSTNTTCPCHCCPDVTWKTCLVNVMARTVGVVVSFMKAGLGGSIQPSSSRNRGWLPKGIMDSSTQKIA